MLSDDTKHLVHLIFSEDVSLEPLTPPTSLERAVIAS